MIRLVTFDLDNTLWDVDRVIRRAEKKMRAWLSVRAPAWARLSHEQLANLRKQVLKDDPRLIHDVSGLRETVLRAALLHCGHPAAQAARLGAGAFAEFLDWRHQVEFFPGALDALDDLADRYTLAALTNGNANFERLHLDRYFSFGYCAADVGASKPHPAMFERALAHAGVAASEAVHVGDNPLDDMAGAVAVGMHTIWVNLVGAEHAVGTTATVTSLAALPAALAALAEARAGASG